MNEHTTRDYSLYSDVHKDAYGFRPRDWDRVRSMTDAEFQAEIDRLCDRASEEAEREDRRELERLFNPPEVTEDTDELSTQLRAAAQVAKSAGVSDSPTSGW